MASLKTILVCGKVYTNTATAGKRPASKQYRSLFIRTYCPESEIKEFLQNTYVDSYAYICHDKDVDESGDTHMAHYHILVHFGQPTRLTQLAKFFVSGNTLAEVVRDKYLCYQYLTHSNSPDKYQYSDDLITSFNSSCYIRLAQCSKEERRAQDIADLLDDIIVMSPYMFAQKYGRDGILNYNRYYQFALTCGDMSPINEIFDSTNHFFAGEQYSQGYLVYFSRLKRLLESVVDNLTIDNCPNEKALLLQFANAILSARCFCDNDFISDIDIGEVDVDA